MLHCPFFLGDISSPLEEWIAMQMQAGAEYNKIAQILESEGNRSIFSQIDFHYYITCSKIPICLISLFSLGDISNTHGVWANMEMHEEAECNGYLFS